MTDQALDEKRVYSGTRSATVAYVASELGLTRVELAGDRIGRFSLVHRDPAATVAGEDGTLIVGTDEDVLIATGDSFVRSGFGPAAAVGLDGATPLAAARDGAVARLAGDRWEPAGAVERPRRLDGDLLAAASGVFRVDDSPTRLRATDARDVAARGPYAATAAGLLAGEDWEPALGSDATLVAATADRACAVADGATFVRADGEWRRAPTPVEEPVADLAYGPPLCAVTTEGTVLVRTEPAEATDGRGGWRSRSLGVDGAVGVAIP